MDDLSWSGGPRLSRPGVEPLIAGFADSLTDRVDPHPDRKPKRHPFRRSHRQTHPADLSTLLGSLAEADRLELARHALNAALESLDSRPFLAAGLLPTTASAVRSHIARGCVVQEQSPGLAYVVAEVSSEVWRLLIEADQRWTPAQTLDPAEAAARRRAVLAELGIDEEDITSFREDLRVSGAASELLSPIAPTGRVGSGATT